MSLHPDAAAFLQRMAGVPQPPDVTVDAFRAAAAAVIPGGERQEIGAVEDRVIPGGAGQPMTVRIYRPEPGPDLAPPPVLVWLHGGSFVRGTLDMFDAGRRSFVKQTGAMIVAVDQRLAPEAPFPAPIEDGYAALCWAIRNAPELGGDPDRVGVAGESSGANLAAALPLMARMRGGPAIAMQVLLEPLLDATSSSTSATAFAEGFLLTRAQITWAFSQYAPRTPLTEPLLSPLLAAELAGLPPAVIVTLEYDPLRDEGERYAARLAEAGVPVRSARVAGMVHHFPGPQFLPTAARLFRELRADRAASA